MGVLLLVRKFSTLFYCDKTLVSVLETMAYLCQSCEEMTPDEACFLRKGQKRSLKRQIFPSSKRAPP